MRKTLKGENYKNDNYNSNFAILADNRIKLNEREKIDKYLDLPKPVEYEVNGDNSCSGCPVNGSQRSSKETNEILHQSKDLKMQTMILSRSAGMLKRVLEIKLT